MAVQTERAALLERAGTVDVRRFAFLDESGANVAMGRSRAWLPRGQELIEPRPMNWGDNLSLVGAIRLKGWLTTAKFWGPISIQRFVTWVRRRLVPRLRPGDRVVMDDLAAYKARAARDLIEDAGAEVRFLPPYSYDFNPIEAAWALLKTRNRAATPRSAAHLRCTAQRAQRVIQPGHFRAWFAHAGRQLE